MLLLLFATPAFGEGAVQVWTCQATTTCTELGACTADPHDISFRLSPLDVQSDATGSYKIAYGTTETEMTWLTYNGPLIWYPADFEQDLLIFSGGENLIWQRLMLGPDGEINGSLTQFLTCEALG